MKSTKLAFITTLSFTSVILLAFFVLLGQYPNEIPEAVKSIGGIVFFILSVAIGVIFAIFSVILMMHITNPGHPENFWK